MKNDFQSLYFVQSAREELNNLRDNPSLRKRFKAVHKTLTFLNERKLRHPSLNTHEYGKIKGINGEKVFEAYAENKTPGAYRIFWYYGPESGDITILAITPHP